ncbi:hypothetical protein, partial [Phocaeicola vulgatus]|uniref:hypothetical protein n=1 Tax=Phocaeicola vulgatus TaxID=821 RepID=UPI00402791E0
ITKPLLVKVGALCIKKEGAHFDTPSYNSLKRNTQEAECLQFFHKLDQRVNNASIHIHPRRV